MTRKRYLKNAYTLALAIRQHCNIDQQMPYKHIADKAKEVAKTYGSYEKAWDSLKLARKTFGVNRQHTGGGVSPRKGERT